MSTTDKNFFWLNNQYLDISFYPKKENQVIVETIGVYNGQPFSLAEHIKQFFDSFQFFLFDARYSQEKIQNICLELIDINKLQNANLSLIMSLNDSEQNLSISFEAKQITKNLSEIDYLTMGLSSAARAITAGKNIPTFLMPNYISKKKSIANGFDDVLMVDQFNNINMASTSNVFFFEQDTLVIAPNEKCFDPVTQRAILKIANSLNIEVTERNINTEYLSSYTEAFICNAKSGIKSISSIQNYKHYSNHLTQEVYSKYYELVHN